tara:strand:- start:155 stop:850 length:696 start_codon:yes stop_codon:yes gene_type:complete
MLLLWFFYCKRRPKLVVILLFMTLFVGLSGAISIARGNLRGFALEKVAAYNPAEIFVASFEEAGVFFTTSAVIESFPSRYSFIGLKPLLTAVSQPIPRSLWSSKPSGAYAKDIPDRIYNVGYKTQAVFLCYGEYYIMFGWPSLIMISLFLGAALRCLWTWFLWRQYEPLAQCVYLLNASYLYVVISRGYLSQVIMLYCTIVLPLVIVYSLLSRREANTNSVFSSGRLGANE